jgi:hypothetical protein
MFSTFIALSVLFGTILSILPPAIMLWYRKALSQRSFGWPFFGYSATILAMGLSGYLFSFLYQSAFPSYHIFILPLAFFTFLLFKNQYYSIRFKKLAYVFLGISLFSEVTEFIWRGGLLTDNSITYSFVNLTFIGHYILYIIDVFKNKPSIIYDKKGPFLIISITFIYSINQLLFSLIGEDIRYLLVSSTYANIIWSMFACLWILYLIIISYYLWKNLRC